MAEDTTTPDVSEDSIPDVSLTNLPDQSGDTNETPGTTADEPHKGADTQDETKSDEKVQDADTTTAEEDTSIETQPSAPSKEERDQLAARAWQERQRARTEVAAKLDQTYGPKTQEDLIQEGLKPADAQVEALRQEMAYERQRGQIADLNASMQIDAVEIQNEMPIFREFNRDGSKNPDFDPDFTKFVEQQYHRAARLEYDDQGTILNADIPLFDHYKSMYDMRQAAIARGEQRGQQNAQSMLSRTENPGGSSSTQGNQSDDLAAMEERLGDIVIT